MNKILKKYLDDEKIALHKTTQEEIDHLFSIVERDLHDAKVSSISADRRHATAYNAALQLATIVLNASGFRAKSKVGHHWVTIVLIPVVMGKEKTSEAQYFNDCRQKRNITDYDFAGHISKEQAEELIEKVQLFKRDVFDWLKKHHPELMKRK